MRIGISIIRLDDLCITGLQILASRWLDFYEWISARRCRIVTIHWSFSVDFGHFQDLWGLKHTAIVFLMV